MIRLFSTFRFYLLAALLIGSAACVDHEFDEPPVGDLTDLQANATIDDLKALHTPGADPRLITQSLLIEGVVAADDRAGNFFRQIAIQDPSGGIILRLNATGLFNDYPVGTRLIIDCEGLYIGDYNNLYQLSGSPDAGIEEALIERRLFVAERGLTVTPTVVTIDALQDASLLYDLQSTLVKFENVQFIDANTQRPYADVVNRLSVNLTLEDCDGDEIIVRTSGYADFAGELSPGGNGSLTAVLSVFGSTRQLILRDPSDVQLSGDRCSSGATGGELMTISDLRAAFTGGATAGPAGKMIRGVVISDAASGNWTGRSLVLQDGTAGIAVRFADNHSYALGEELEINISGEELSEFAGLLQVNEVPLSNVNDIGPGALPAPRVSTIGQLLANLENWESTLVRLNGVRLEGLPTYDGSVTVSDGTDDAVLFTRSAAAFSGTALPTDPVDLIAVVSQFNDLQLIIRGLGDVVAGNSNGNDPDQTSVLALRRAFAEGATAAPAGQKIRGIVISDKDGENITGRNLVLQDTSGGIVIRFLANHDFALGEEIEVNVSGMELSEFSGLLQVNNVPNAQAVSFGPGVLPTAREATIIEILENMAGDESWESTLVVIRNAVIEGGGAYSGTKTLKDATGSIDLFTRAQANFAGSEVPAGDVGLYAIVSQFTAPQLNMRNVSDLFSE